MMIYS